jgi:hypothetical protein
MTSDNLNPAQFSASTLSFANGRIESGTRALARHSVADVTDRVARRAKGSRDGLPVSGDGIARLKAVDREIERAKKG